MRTVKSKSAARMNASIERSKTPIELALKHAVSGAAAAIEHAHLAGLATPIQGFTSADIVSLAAEELRHLRWEIESKRR